MCNLWAGSGSRLLVLGLKRKDQRCQFGFGGGSRPLVSFFRRCFLMEQLDLGLLDFSRPDGCQFRFGWLESGSRLLVLGLEASGLEVPVQVWGQYSSDEGSGGPGPWEALGAWEALERFWEARHAR